MLFVGPGQKEDRSFEALLSSRLVGRQEQGVGGWRCGCREPPWWVSWCVC